MQRACRWCQIKNLTLFDFFKLRKQNNLSKIAIRSGYGAGGIALVCHTHAQPKSASQRIGPFPIFLKYWRGFQGMEVKAIKMTFLSPFFFCNIWSAQIQAWSPPHADKACGQMKASPESPPSLHPEPGLQLMVIAG